MSHRDRSISNMRCEAKRIYNQRRYINKLEKDKKELQQKIDKAIEELTYMSTDAYVEDYDIKDKYWELLLEILTSFTDKTIENTRKILRGGGDNE